MFQGDLKWYLQRQKEYLRFVVVQGILVSKAVGSGEQTLLEDEIGFYIDTSRAAKRTAEILREITKEDAAHGVGPVAVLCVGDDGLPYGGWRQNTEHGFGEYYGFDAAYMEFYPHKKRSRYGGAIPQDPVGREIYLRELQRKVREEFRGLLKLY